MGKTDYIAGLLKFGSEKDMRDLINNGTIYLNPIHKFRAIEDNNLRGDSYEGIKRIWNLPSGIFEIPYLSYRGNYISMHLRESYENILGNIYSLYCISSHGFDTPKDFYIDERVKEFGTHFVFIKDIPLFFDRIKHQLLLTGHNFYHGFVEYYDKTKMNGEITVFQKPNEFEYQKEFRFYLESKNILPLSFRIGRLSNIAEIHPVEVASGITASSKIK